MCQFNSVQGGSKIVPRDSKLCLYLYFACPGQPGVVNAAVDIIAEKRDRDDCSYHFTPPTFYPATSIPRLQPRCGSGFSHS